jgi:hypothetical protein
MADISVDLTANGLEAGESFMLEQSRDDIVPLADPEVESRPVRLAFMSYMGTPVLVMGKS